MNNALATLKGYTDPQPNDIQAELVKALGTAPGGLLAPLSSGQLGQAPLYPASPRNPATTTPYVVVTTDPKVLNSDDGVEIELQLQKVLTITQSLQFATGLPALPITVTTQGNIVLQVGFAFELAFTYDSKTNKVGLDPNAKLNDYTGTVGNPLAQGTTLPDTNHQLAVFVSATLPQGNPQANPPVLPFSAQANIGFLQGTVTDIGTASNPTQFSGSFVMDGLGNGGTPTPELDGAANAYLHLDAGFGDNFPSIAADFTLNWSFSSNGDNTSPTVKFTNVSLDLGTFVSQFLTPILKDIQKVTEPLQPVLKVLGTPIPGLSDLSNALGLGNITLMELSQVAAQNTGYGPLFALIEKVADVVSDLNTIQFTGGNVSLPFGSFDLGSTDLLTTQAASTVSQLTASLPSLSDLSPEDLTGPDGFASFNMDQVLAAVAQQVGSKMPAATQGVFDKLTAGLNNGFDIEFPILDNPGQAVFGLLLGRDSDLVTLTANFTASANGGQATGLSFAGVDVGFTGNVNVDFHFKLAYDTYGLRMALQDFVNGQTGKIGNDLLDGFYVADTVTSGGVTYPAGLGISGYIGAEAGVSIGVASVNIGGFVGTGNNGSDPIVISVSDPKASMDGGKLRLLMPGSSGGIMTRGELDASLAIVVQIGVTVLGNFIGYQKVFDIATVKLVDFDPPPPSTSPVLASEPDSNGQVTLYVGQDASDRGGNDSSGNPINQTDGNENYTIDHVGGSTGDETIKVSAFGVTQTIQHVRSIAGYGDVGNLTVTVDPGVKAALNLHGGQEQAFFTDNGSGTASLFAGVLGGTLIGGTGINYLYGGSAGGSAAQPDTTLMGGNGTSMTNLATNYLYAGAASAILDGGGPNSTNQLFAGAQSSANPGATTTMNAKGGVNLYGWNEGDDPLTVNGANPNSLANANQLNVLVGTQGGETWSVTALPQGGGYRIQGTDAGGNAIAGTPTITFSGMSGLSLDAVGARRPPPPRFFWQSHLGFSDDSQRAQRCRPAGRTSDRDRRRANAR